MNPAGWYSKNLIMIMGKGGVGKTTLAQATARHLASQGKRTLLCHVLQLEPEHQKLEKVAPNLSQITLRPSDCFSEYIMLKLKLKPLYTAFLGNKLTQYLERAAPGVREMVLLGKIWFERENYDHVVVDMPSTGYALTMIHTPFNFASLFPGGPVYADAIEMIETFSDPAKTAFVTASLAEEMPIQESIELADNLKKLMPKNPSWLVVNRLARVAPEARLLHLEKWPGLDEKEKASPLWQGLDYLVRKEQQQASLLNALREEWAPYTGTWLEVDEVQAVDDRQRSSAIANQMSSLSGKGGQAHASA